jgi:hypothetical protein
MPARGRFRRPQPQGAGAFFGRLAHQAPQPVAVAAPVIDMPRLKLAYEWMGLDKMTGYKMVIDWYAKNQIALNIPPLSADQRKKQDLAQKAIDHGNSPNIPDPEKIQAYRTALRIMEGLWSHKAADWPLIDHFENPTHIWTLGPHVKSVETVLSRLNAAYGNAGCTFRPTYNADRDLLPGEVRLPVAELEAMIQKPAAEVVINAAAPAAKALSIVMNEGAMKVAAGQLLANLPKVLQFAADWVLQAGGLKPIGRVRTQAAPPVPGAAPTAAKPGMHVSGLLVNDAMTIHPTGKPAPKGAAGLLFNLIKPGMTVRQLRKDAEAAFGAAYKKSMTLYNLKVMIIKGVVTVQ